MARRQCNTSLVWMYMHKSFFYGQQLPLCSLCAAGRLISSKCTLQIIMQFVHSSLIRVVHEWIYLFNYKSTPQLSEYLTIQFKRPKNVLKFPKELHSHANIDLLSTPSSPLSIVAGLIWTLNLGVNNVHQLSVLVFHPELKNNLGTSWNIFRNF
jgi:hypothetical protein